MGEPSMECAVGRSLSLGKIKTRVAVFFNVAVGLLTRCPMPNFFSFPLMKNRVRLCTKIKVMKNYLVRFLSAFDGAFLIRETYLEGEMKEIRKDVMSGKKFHPSQDRLNLRRDMQHIGRDMRKARKDYRQARG